MILRIDRLGTQLPPPSDPDPAGAAAVQELMGGRFGEMSTLMNYTFQSFNFRGRQGARPFYDLLCNIAAEEYGHIELVAAAINTMLTGATPIGDGKAPSDSLGDLKGVGNPQHFIAGGQGALCQDSNGQAVIPECQPHIERGEHTKLYRFSPSDYREIVAVFSGPHPETGEELEVVDHPPEGALANDLPPQPAVFAPDYAPEEIKEIAQRLREQAGLPKEPTGEVANGPSGLVGKVADKLSG
jgi:Mn-containing catalase